jgi:hypothetical protein
LKEFFLAKKRKYGHVKGRSFDSSCHFLKAKGKTGIEMGSGAKLVLVGESSVCLQI